MWWLAGVGAVLLIGLAWFGLCQSGAHVCLFHRLTGWPCLTCGSTRAFAALLAGNPAAALRLQPLALAVGVLGCAFFAVYSTNLFVRRRVLCLRLKPGERWRLGVAALTLIVLNWLYLICSAR